MLIHAAAAVVESTDAESIAPDGFLDFAPSLPLTTISSPAPIVVPDTHRRKLEELLEDRASDNALPVRVSPFRLSRCLR
jgi:hypothetical protein